MSSPATSLLTRLEELVGATNVLAETEQLAGYKVDGLRPAAVVRPGSAEEVAQVVRFAAAEKLAVIPVGARTKLGIGAPPRRYDLAVDMTRLDRVLAYDPGDLTLGVEAGIGLAKLADVLAEHRQVLPLAVPFTNQTTAGGTLASDVDTPLRQFYGPARDYVLGMEFVTGEGALAKSGGRVVKNVTGYDLHKLLIGALGTLGVLTRINFRTFPRPPASRGFLASFPEPGSALELRHRIAQSPLTPATLEILSPEVAQVFARSTPATLGSLPLPGPWFPTSHWLLAAAFAGNERVLERYAKDLTQMAEQAGATNSIVLGDDERPLVWGRLREFIPLMLESSPAATLIHIAVLPTRLGEILAQAQQIAERHALPCAALARGVGVAYVALLPPPRDAATLGRLAQACTSLFEVSGSVGGHAMVQWCPTELKSQVNVWGPPRDDFALMQRLKKAFDPQGILSPGRFVGGI
jgi:glycolate oxidase FAD binding subunit